MGHSGKSGGRGGRRGRLPPARVEWLPATVNTANIKLNNVTTIVRQELYDFGDVATVEGAKFGGGDWTMERMIGHMGIASVGALNPKVIKICIGIGMVGVSGSIVDPAATSTLIQAPGGRPDLSWMMRICCYVHLQSFSVEKCEFDLGRSRKIEPDAKLVMVAEAAGMVATEEVEIGYDFRTLVRQRGSRL